MDLAKPSPMVSDNQPTGASGVSPQQSIRNVVAAYNVVTMKHQAKEARRTCGRKREMCSPEMEIHSQLYWTRYGFGPAATLKLWEHVNFT